MKIYVQTETVTPEAVSEPRGKVLVMETSAGATAIGEALTAISQGLGVITAIPAPAHEVNLKAILPRDLATFSIAPGASAGGEVILKVIRTPGETGAAGQAEVIGLSYNVIVREAEPQA